MLRSELALDPALKMSYINIRMHYVKTYVTVYIRTNAYVGNVLENNILDNHS